MAQRRDIRWYRGVSFEVPAGRTSFMPQAYQVIDDLADAADSFSKRQREVLLEGLAFDHQLKGRVYRGQLCIAPAQRQWELQREIDERYLSPQRRDLNGYSWREVGKVGNAALGAYLSGISKRPLHGAARTAAQGKAERLSTMLRAYAAEGFIDHRSLLSQIRADRTDPYARSSFGRYLGVTQRTADRYLRQLDDILQSMQERSALTLASGLSKPLPDRSEA